MSRVRWWHRVTVLWQMAGEMVEAGPKQLVIMSSVEWAEALAAMVAEYKSTKVAASEGATPASEEGSKVVN